MELTVRLQQWEGCSSLDLSCVWQGARMELPAPQAAADLLQINVGRCCLCLHHHRSCREPARSCVRRIPMLATAHSMCTPVPVTCSFGMC